MQDGWERRHPFLDLAPAAIERLLASGFLGARVLDAEPLAGGLRNTNYLVRLDGREQPVVLRLYTADPAACRREAALARMLGANVPVPAILHADPVAEPPFAVMAWVDGVKLDDLIRTGSTADVEAAAYAAGRVLAAIHAYQFPRAGFLGPDLEVAQPLDPSGDGWASYIEDFVSHAAVAEHLGSDLTRRLREFVRENASRLDVLRDDRALVHADFKPWNLLVRPDHQGGGWAVAAVLDWEFALAFTPLADLAIFLRHEATLPPGYTRGFVRGYRDGGGLLPEDWRALTKLLDLLNLCSMLDGPSLGTAFTRDARALIADTVDAGAICR